MPYCTLTACFPQLQEVSFKELITVGEGSILYNACILQFFKMFFISLFLLIPMRKAFSFFHKTKFSLTCIFRGLNVFHCVKNSRFTHKICVSNLCKKGFNSIT